MNNNHRISTAATNAFLMVLASSSPFTTAFAATVSRSAVPVLISLTPRGFGSGRISQAPKEITNYLPSPQQPSELAAVSDIIGQAQTVLGISKQHLASIFGISRQNLYNLIGNHEQIPTPDTAARAWQVKKALEVIAEECPYQLGASTMTCRINGQRLLDELLAQDIDLGQVRLFAQAIAKRIHTQQAASFSDKTIRGQEFMDTVNVI
jgi:hypothetical protein